MSGRPWYGNAVPLKIKSYEQLRKSSGAGAWASRAQGCPRRLHPAGRDGRRAKQDLPEPGHHDRRPAIGPFFRPWVMIRTPRGFPHPVPQVVGPWHEGSGQTKRSGQTRETGRVDTEWDDFRQPCSQK